MYDQMLDLTKRNEAFFFADYERFGNKYRVFNYRLASWTDFQEPFALEMRGITYLLHPEHGPIIVSRPFAKFFNLGENPSTMNLDLSQATCYEEKADGSLIATFHDPHTRRWGIKSKQSFFSEQAIMAENLLRFGSISLNSNSPIDDILSSNHTSVLVNAIAEWMVNDYTVLMELCSPANRIVIEYETTHLKVHGIRHNQTGEYIQRSSLSPSNPLYKAWVDQVICQGLPEDFVASTLLKTGIEGYVVHGPWGRFKLKTEWYQNLHHLKDSVSTTKSLIESIIYERVDDVKQMFSTDTFTLDRIKTMEDIVIPKYNHIVRVVEEFYEANKQLPRKEYAIKGQSDLGEYFHLTMTKYLGRPVDYQGFCMKYYKELFNVGNEDGDQGNKD